MNTKKTPVRFLARLAERDQRTVLGRTLTALLQTCGLGEEDLPSLHAGLVKTQMMFRPAPDGEEWRIPLAQELLNLRSALELPGFSREELEELLEYTCTT